MSEIHGEICNDSWAVMQIEKPVKFIMPGWHVNQFKIRTSDQVSV